MVDFEKINADWHEFLNLLTLFRLGGGQKASPTSFFPVTSANIGIGRQNFLTFTFDPFATLVLNFKAIPRASPKLLNLNQDHLWKKRFFWSNPFKIDVVITSLREMLELPNFNFSQRNARVTKLWSHDHICHIIWALWQKFSGDVMGRNYDVITFIWKYLYFKKA